MNFMQKVIFKNLLKTTSDKNIGTMKCESMRLLRHNVDANVIKAFEAEKEFINLFTEGKIIEAAKHYYGIDGQMCETTKERDGLTDFIDTYVNPGLSGVPEHNFDA